MSNNTFTIDMMAELVKMREAKGITQREMADYIGMSIYYLDHIERLLVPVTVDYFKKYCKRLGVSFDVSGQLESSYSPKDIYVKPKDDTEYKDKYFQGEKYWNNIPKTYERLDVPKRDVSETRMTPNKYQKLAMRTNDLKADSRLTKALYDNKSAEGISVGGVLNGVLGLTGESGEFADVVKKWIFHEKPLDMEHAKKELGDVMWYIAMICESFGWSLEDIMTMNIDKLMARYPDGFDTNRANHRAEGDV